MPSAEAKQLRATFVKNPEAPGVPLEVQRRAWEAAVEATNRTLNVTVEPLQLGELHGEWIAGGSAADTGVILYLHGGGFNAGSSKTHRALAAHLAEATHLPVVLIDYRLAPEHPFPAAVEDAVAAYRWLLEDVFSARQIVLGGDSAGAGLVAATLLQLRDTGLALPAAAFLISPWVDLTLTGQSLDTRAHVDPLTTYEGLKQAVHYYVGDGDPRHPLASPLFADLRGLPPLLIQAGDHERLLSDATRMTERARAAGVSVELEVWEEMWHVWHAWTAELPEAHEAIDHIAAFVQRQLAAPESAM